MRAFFFGVLIALIVLLLFMRDGNGQDFKYNGKVCATAPVHKHDDITAVTMYVTSWDGCQMRGVIRGGKFAGKTYVLFGGFDKNAKLNAKQKVKVVYDRSCGQVLFAVWPKDPGIK